MMTFDQRVDTAIKEMSKIGYKPTLFMEMRSDYGTVDAIKKLIHSKEISSGFYTLWEHKRLDLSMENIIQEPMWKSLFSDDDRTAALKRLKQYEFIP